MAQATDAKGDKRRVSGCSQFCWRGEACPFAESHEEFGDPEEVELEIDNCSICCEPSNEYGLLSCTHCFCLHCITTWRATKNNPSVSSKIHINSILSCPACRAPTQLVTPSKIFLRGQAKDKAIAAHKAALALIPCPLFKQSSSDYFCAVGRACPHQHLADGINYIFEHDEASFLEINSNRQQASMILSLFSVVPQPARARPVRQSRPWELSDDDEDSAPVTRISPSMGNDLRGLALEQAYSTLYKTVGASVEELTRIEGTLRNLRPSELVSPRYNGLISRSEVLTNELQHQLSQLAFIAQSITTTTGGRGLENIQISVADGTLTAMLASFGGEEEGMWEDEHDEDEDEDDEDEDESDEEDDDDDEDDEEESEEESEEDSEGSEEESEEEEEIQNPQRRATPYSSGPVQITEAPYILPEISEAALANAQTRMNEDID